MAIPQQSPTKKRNQITAANKAPSVDHDIAPSGWPPSLLEHLVKNCPINVAVFDRDLRLLMASERYLNRGDFSAAEIIGKKLLEIYPQLKPRWVASYRRALEGHVEKATDDIYTWPDGSMEYSRWEIHPWYVESGRIESGEVGGVIVFTEYITKRRKTEDALRESQRRMETLLANLPGMAYRCRNEANFPMEFISDGCRGLTGYGVADLIGSPDFSFRDLILRDDDDYEATLIAQHRCLAASQPYELTYRIRTKQGRVKWVWERGVGIYNKDGRLEAMEGFITDFTAQKQTHEALRQENIRLKSSLPQRRRHGNIVGASAAMQAVYDVIDKAARSAANVIIVGESGTGKELVARAIHQGRRGHRQAFVAVNCNAIPEHLIESEFFGHRKGAFTGAYTDRSGVLQQAHQGTLFLDEVGDISLGMQAKLLRVIEDGRYTPVGGNSERTSDFRLIGATHRNLTDMVERGAMREDFFYRISVIPIFLPPLRQRRDDIPVLIDHFLKSFSKQHPPPILSGQQLEKLMNHSWPGNVRELQNVLQRFLAVRTLDFFTTQATAAAAADAEVLFAEPAAPPAPAGQLQQRERDLIMETLQITCWNRTVAAKRLGISRRALFRRIQKYDLQALVSGVSAR